MKLQPILSRNWIQTFCGLGYKCPLTAEYSFLQGVATLPLPSYPRSPHSPRSTRRTPSARTAWCRASPRSSEPRTFPRSWSAAETEPRQDLGSSGAHISHQRLEARSWGFYSLKMRRYWPQYLFTLVCSSCFMQITLFAEFLDISRLMFQLHLPILLFTSSPLLASIHTQHYTTQFVDVNQNSRLQLHLVQ